jgi:hypothetical protein
VDDRAVDQRETLAAFSDVVAAGSTDQLDESLDAPAIRLTAEQVSALDNAPAV